MDISLGFQSHYNNPIEYVDDLRHRLIEGAELGHVEECMAESFHSDSEADPTDFDSTVSQYGSEAMVKVVESRRTSTCFQLADETYDTFEHCLQKANEMESVIAFYYQDDNNPNMVRVTEIFSIEDGHNHGRSRHGSKRDLTGIRQDQCGKIHDLKSSKQGLNREGSSELDWDASMEKRRDAMSMEMKKVEQQRGTDTGTLLETLVL